MSINFDKSSICIMQIYFIIKINIKMYFNIYFVSYLMF